MSKLKNRIAILFFCSIFAAVVGLNIYDFDWFCNSLDSVWKPFLITNSVIDPGLKESIEFHNHCKFSEAAYQDGLVQIKITPRYYYTFGIENPEKIVDLNLYDSILSFLKSANNTFSAIQILLQKESFLS
jgi:hypothetical protein